MILIVQNDQEDKDEVDGPVILREISPPGMGSYTTETEREHEVQDDCCVDHEEAENGCLVVISFRQQRVMTSFSLDLMLY